MEQIRSDFTFRSIESQYKKALEYGYEIITCSQYVILKAKKILPKLIIVNRVDIDMSMKKADRLRLIFDKLGIKATFFVRLHAKEYNPFSFECYRILKKIRDSGHEIGYHSEIIDQSSIWNEDPEYCLIKDISILNTMLDINIQGVASHGGMTGLNNLDFWKNKRASEFGLLYEAYDRENEFNLFNSSFYISDSEWIRWKCYNNGVICNGDNRSFQEHLLLLHPVIYLLIHPDTYFDNHIYED
jgi:hypothetical protein